MEQTAEAVIIAGVALITAYALGGLVGTIIAGIKEERVKAAKQLRGPRKKKVTGKARWIQAIHDALYCSKICVYAQGFQLMRAAQSEYDWDFDFGEIARIWRGGCIIRAVFLQKIRSRRRRPGPARPNASKITLLAAMQGQAFVW